MEDYTYKSRIFGKKLGLFDYELVIYLSFSLTTPHNIVSLSGTNRNSISASQWFLFTFSAACSSEYASVYVNYQMVVTNKSRTILWISVARKDHP